MLIWPKIKSSKLTYREEDILIRESNTKISLKDLLIWVILYKINMPVMREGGSRLRSRAMLLKLQKTSKDPSIDP